MLIPLLLAIVVIFIAWKQSCMLPQFERSRYLTTYAGSPRNDDTIFVSVASYRDSDCSKTINDMFAKAKHPRKVFVGIVQQNKPGFTLETCSYPVRYRENIRKITMDYQEARGPCFARQIATSLYKGEHFFMQIDSHTTFADNWDEKIKTMWKAKENPRAVFSHYPKDMESKNTTNVPVNCNSRLGTDGMPMFYAVELKPNDRRRTYFIGAGFLFGHGQMLFDVPFDPELDMLFQGEEVLYSARLYTHGYDVFAPSENIVYHYYGREDQPHFWNDISDPELYRVVKKQSEDKVKNMLDVKSRESVSGFGFGTKRSLSSFFEVSGLSMSDNDVTFSHCYST